MPEPADHRLFAVDCFNETWTYLERDDLTPDEVDRMVSTAHASLYHWLRIGEPVNFARSHWQVSRAYAVAGVGERAIHHGDRCLALCEEHGIGDFDLAFAYEALARGHAVAGDGAAAERCLAQAREAAAIIADQKSRELVEADLATIRV